MTDSTQPTTAAQPVMLPRPPPRGPVRRATRRRPSGAPPPLPHHLETTGLGWLVVLVGIVIATVIVFRRGLQGPAINATVIDDTVVGWVSALELPGLHNAAIAATALSSWWSIQLMSFGLPVVLIAFRRWRHLLVAEVVIQLAVMLWDVLYTASTRPRPFGVELEAGWGGWALPSEQMLATTGMLVLGLYTLVPYGRTRNLGKFIVGALVAIVALARIHLGVDAPTDIAVAVSTGVAFPVVAFRMFLPNAYFPVTYRRGRAAHLDVGGARGAAIRTALEEQLGLVVVDIKPVGLAGSAGSTPLRIRVEGTPELLFGKLYSRSHMRSDRWYKLGRELLYGRLEDEKPFNAVRRLVQQEDYALRVFRDAGVPTATPMGFVELTPEREYLLVTEFFADAVELGEATVDVDLIDDGLRLIRVLWNAGLAHRDIKPANLMVSDGRMLVIDVAFAEMRPSPWRQAVDLANMMLCLALRSSPQRVYERALLQFSVEEISEGFAAARGLALPSQLRRALRAQGRDLHSEFIRLLPEPPQPIKVQRWTPRRVVIWVGLLLAVALLALNGSQVFSNSEASRTPLNIRTLECPPAAKLEPLLLEAQAVQSASHVPCVNDLPPGWTFGGAHANSGRAGFTIDHDRAGVATLEVTLTKRCVLSGAIEVDSDVEGVRRFAGPSSATGGLDRTWYDVFEGGCVTTEVHSKSSTALINAEVERQAPGLVGYVTRPALARALDERSDGRLELDPD